MIENESWEHIRNEEERKVSPLKLHDLAEQETITIKTKLPDHTFDKEMYEDLYEPKTRVYSGLYPGDLQCGIIGLVEGTKYALNSIKRLFSKYRIQAQTS